MTRAMRKLGGRGRPLQVGLIGLLLAAVALSGCARRMAPAPLDDRSSLFFGRGTAIPVARPATERPPVSTAAAIFTRAGTATVQAGDTLYGISRRNNVPLRAIINANNLAPPYTLRVGRQLILPRQAYHEVTAGDTVASIARAYRVSTQELVRLNAIESPYLIYVGQPVLLPTAAPAGADAPANVASFPTDPAAVVRSAGAGPAQPQGTSAPSPGDTLITSVSPNAAGAQPPVSQPVTATMRPPTDATSASERRMAADQTPAPPSAVGQAITGDAPPPERLASLPSPAAPLPEVPITAPPGAFIWPVQGNVVSSYGPKPGGLFNDGINIAVPEGTPVRAAQDGEVAYAGNELRGYGNLLLLRHENGWMTAYAHNQALLVDRGAKIRRGQVIARSGSTGSAGAPQVHFEMRQGTRAVDPTRYLAGQGITMR